MSVDSPKDSQIWLGAGCRKIVTLYLLSQSFDAIFPPRLLQIQVTAHVIRANSGLHFSKMCTPQRIGTWHSWRTTPSRIRGGQFSVLTSTAALCASFSCEWCDIMKREWLEFQGGTFDSYYAEFPKSFWVWHKTRLGFNKIVPTNDHHVGERVTA